MTNTNQNNDSSKSGTYCYIRINLGNQNGESYLESRKAQCEEAAKQAGLTIEEYYFDRAASESNVEPEFDRLVSDL